MLVGGCLNAGDEILVAVIDRGGGAELAADFAFRRVARGRYYFGFGKPRELDCDRADAARAAVDEQPFAGFQPAEHEDVEPRGEQRFGQRGGEFQIEAFRYRQRYFLRGNAVLRVAAAVDERANAVARLSSA